MVKSIIITLVIFSTITILLILNIVNYSKYLIYVKANSAIITQENNIWQTAPSETSPEIDGFMRDWKKADGWSYNFLNDDEVKDHLMSNFPTLNFTQIYEQNPILAFDLFRYSIIYKEGGLYADSDVAKEPTFEKSMESLNECGIIVGVEADLRHEADWIKKVPRSLQLCQWSFYAAKNHPLMGLVVERVVRAIEYFQIRNISLVDKDVMEITGPGIWTDTISDYILVQTGVSIKDAIKCGGSYKFDDVCILNVKGFSLNMQHSCHNEKVANTFIVSNHYFLGSWKYEE